MASMAFLVAVTGTVLSASPLQSNVTLNSVQFFQILRSLYEP